MVSITTVVSALCLAIATSAAPTEQETRAAANTGSMTYYEVGLGACGATNSDSELVCAVSHILYDSEHPCGRNIRINNEGRSVVVRVVDRCVGCAENDLDLSPTAFQQVIGPLGIGRATATWEWV
ncbi:expansin module family protein [Trichoderma sp. SZMC 28014]